MNNKVDHVVTDLTGQIDSMNTKVDGAVGSLNSKIDGVAADFTGRVDQLEKKMENSVLSSAGSGSTRAPGQASSASNPTAQWTPHFLRITGWVTNWANPSQRGAEMKTETEIDAIIKAVVAAIPAEMRAIIDQGKTKTQNMGRPNGLYAQAHIQFHDGTDREDIFKLRGEIQTLIKDDKIPYLNALARVQLEVSPMRAQFNRNAAYFHEAWKSCRPEGVSLSLKAEIARGELAMWTHPQDLSSQRPEILATWTQKKGWSLEMDRIRVIAANLTSDQLMAALRDQEQ